MNDNIGALWLKNGKNGQFLTGKIKINDEDLKIVIFKNTYKTKETQPDYSILKARDTQQQEEQLQEDITRTETLPF